MTHSILLIGAGAREVALARAIRKSKKETTLTTLAPYKNPQLAALSDAYILAAIDDIEAIGPALANASFDKVVIGPEAPLAAGLADYFEERGIACFGPKKALARLESSKIYARNLLSQHLRPHLPDYQSFSEQEALNEFLKSYGSPFVIKANGLMGGKGVFVEGEHFHTFAEALAICKNIQEKQVNVLIEEKLVGEEFSLLSFCDGKTLKHMPLVQDNKRAFVEDKGPNTGGMGSISYPDHGLPFLCSDEISTAQRINEQAIKALQADTGLSYRGVLYGGYMKTPNGIKLIEFNCRFGCPEAVNLLPLLETDFIDILEAIETQSLAGLSLTFSKQATVCKYVVPEGYPDKPVKGEKISADLSSSALYFASIDQDCHLMGSRAVATLGTAETLAEAEKIAEVEAKKIDGPVFHRSDIGSQELIQKRLDRIKVLCHDNS